MSAQQATQLEAIHASSSVEQAWCIAIDKTRKLQLEIIEDHGPVERFTRVVDSWSVEYNVLLAISKWYHTRKEYVWTVGPL